MTINPYESVDSLRFGSSTSSDCVAVYGQPRRIRRNRYNVPEYHYADFILRFDPATDKLSECTLLPRKTASVDGINVTWDHTFLRRACAADQGAREVLGFIVLPRLGIAVTGIHDDDASQLAITAFARGGFDEFMAQSVPFQPSE